MSFLDQSRGEAKKKQRSSGLFFIIENCSIDFVVRIVVGVNQKEV